MKSMKKSVIAVLVLGTLSVAGMAFAYHGEGNGQTGGYFGGHHPMMGQQWNGTNPAPQTPNGAPCFCGRNGQMGWQRAPFQAAPGQCFNGQGLGQKGGPRQGRGFAPALGEQGGRGPRGEQFQRREAGPLGQRGMFAPDMPQEIRAKVVEAEKLHIDLENVLSQKPLNKDKAVELNGQISKLRQEVQAWRFEQKLNRIEEFNKKPAEDGKAGQDK